MRYVLKSDMPRLSMAEAQGVQVVGFELDDALYGDHAENAQIALDKVRDLIRFGVDAKTALRRLGWADTWNPGDLADTPSGMGGALTVRLKYRAPNGGWVCVVHMPRNPDWHGVPWFAQESQLKPVDAQKIPA